MGVRTADVDGATWNSTDRTVWPDGAKASELYKLLKKQVATVTTSPAGSIIFLMGAYDEVFKAVVFREYMHNALVTAVKTAVETFRNKETWYRVLRRVMNLDFSWRASALKYESIYH